MCGMSLIMSDKPLNPATQLFASILYDFVEAHLSAKHESWGQSEWTLAMKLPYAVPSMIHGGRLVTVWVQVRCFKHLKPSQVMQEFVHRMYVYWHIGHYWGSHVQIKSLCTSIASWLMHIIFWYIMYSLYTTFTSGKMNAAWRFTKKGFQCFDSCFLFTSTWEDSNSVQKGRDMCVYIYIFKETLDRSFSVPISWTLKKDQFKMPLHLH